MGQPTAEHLRARAADIHQRNVDAGWWTDLATGESLKGKRSPLELLALVHSEISEALEGDRKNLMDDKLPHRSMFEVELADAAIRCFDMAGGFDLELSNEYPISLGIIWRQLAGAKGRSESLGWLHLYTSAVMKDFAENSYHSNPANMTLLIRAIYQVAALHGLDLDGAIDEKLAYNAQRADHKPENRKLVGGKAY